MTTQTAVPTPANAPVTIKDLHTENPRWCAGCGDFGVIMGLKRFIVDRQLVPSQTVNVSGIGCSGRARITLTPTACTQSMVVRLRWL